MHALTTHAHPLKTIQIRCYIHRFAAQTHVRQVESLYIYPRRRHTSTARYRSVGIKKRNLAGSGRGKRSVKLTSAQAYTYAAASKAAASVCKVLSRRTIRVYKKHGYTEFRKCMCIYVRNSIGYDGVDRFSRRWWVGNQRGRWFVGEKSLGFVMRRGEWLFVPCVGI